MPSEKLPTPEDWAEWLSNPCTKVLRKWARDSKQNLMELWAAGEFSGAFTTEFIVKNVGATGACSIYAEIIEMDYQQIATGEDDGEQVGIDPSGESSTGGTV